MDYYLFSIWVVIVCLIALLCYLWLYMRHVETINRYKQHIAYIEFVILCKRVGMSADDIKKYWRELELEE